MSPQNKRTLQMVPISISAASLKRLVEYLSSKVSAPMYNNLTGHLYCNIAREIPLPRIEGDLFHLLMFQASSDVCGFVVVCDHHHQTKSCCLRRSVCHLCHLADKTLSVLPLLSLQLTEQCNIAYRVLTLRYGLSPLVCYAADVIQALFCSPCSFCSIMLGSQLCSFHLC